MQPTSMQFTFFQDPGHGWVAVPHYLVKELELEDKVSPFSYIDEVFVYLEEDADAPLLFAALEARGIEHDLVEQIFDDESQVRQKTSYRKHYPKRYDFVEMAVFVDLEVKDSKGETQVIDGQFSWPISAYGAELGIETKIRESVSDAENTHLKGLTPIKATTTRILVIGQIDGVHATFPLKPLTLKF